VRANFYNGCFGLASSAWTVFISVREGIEESARFIGVVAGAAAAVISLMIAVRTWRKKK
jgi:hypothetical protein